MRVGDEGVGEMRLTLEHYLLELKIYIFRVILLKNLLTQFVSNVILCSFYFTPFNSVNISKYKTLG